MNESMMLGAAECSTKIRYYLLWNFAVHVSELVSDHLDDQFAS